MGTNKHRSKAPMSQASIVEESGREVPSPIEDPMQHLQNWPDQQEQFEQ